jgi:hypothetical protein
MNTFHFLRAFKLKQHPDKVRTLQEFFKLKLSQEQKSKIDDLIEAIHLQELLESILKQVKSESLDEEEEKKRMAQEMTARISSMIPHITILPENIEKKEPKRSKKQIDFERELYESSCLQSFVFAKPIHEKCFNFQANPDEPIWQTISSMFGFHIVDCRGIPTDESKDSPEFKLPALTFPYPKDPPYAPLLWKTLILPAEVPTILRSESVCEVEDEKGWMDTTTVIVPPHPSLLQCSLLRDANLWFTKCMTEHERVDSEKLITLSEILSFWFDHDITLVNIIDMTCRTSCLFEPSELDLESVQAIRKAKAQERATSVKGQAWLDLFKHQMGRRKSQKKKKNRK